MKRSFDTIIIESGLSILLLLLTATADFLCEVRVDCPMNHTQNPIQVAGNTVLLSSVFEHCAPDSVREDVIIEPDAVDSVALFIIIDQSHSMKIYDSTNIRFDIVNQIIDSVYSRSPASKIGLAIFSNQLLHSYEDHSWFVPLFDNKNKGWHDSYVPLTKLSDSVDGVSPVEKLKWAIKLSDQPDIFGMKTLENGNYGPTGRHDPRLTPPRNNGYNGATDISLGFQAAKHAFQNTSYSVENQVIIFISDGEAQGVDLERQDKIDNYILGEDIPTTLTVVIGETVIPVQLNQMNNNIRNNGYSYYNRSSTIWESRITRQEQILSRFLAKVQPTLEPDLGYYKSTPISMTINGIDATLFTDSTVLFPPYSFPLIAKMTHFDITYTYAFTTTPEPVEYTRDFQIYVVQSDTPQLEPVSCWLRDEIAVFYDGNSVSVIEEDMQRLEVRFFPELDIHENITLSIQTSSSWDSLNLTLTDRAAYLNNSFDWVYATPQTDNILQIQSGDSIIIIYRNPAIPFDTIRVALPVIPHRDLAVKDVWYLDRNADGHPDQIKVFQGKDRLSAKDLSVLAENITVVTQRGIVIKDIIPHEVGFVIRLQPPQQDAEPFTSLYPLERLVIQRTELPTGTFFPATEITITDKMAPVIVDATYYDHWEQADTLVVTFSEPLLNIKSEKQFVFIVGGREIIVTMESAQKRGSKVIFSVNPPEPGTLSEQDSVRIHIDAMIGDTLANFQLIATNRIVPLQYIKVYNGLNAYYYDTNSNGLIDRVSVTTDRVPDSSALHLFTSAVSLPEFRNLHFSADDFSITDSGFVIDVNQKMVLPNTSVHSEDIVEISPTLHNTTLINHSSLYAADRIPPVILKAIYIDSEKLQQEITDTLIVSFSENIIPPSHQFPFTFTTSDGDRFTMKLTYINHMDNGRYAFLVEDIVGTDFPQWGDSISINPDAEISDPEGNIQNSTNKNTILIIQNSQQQFRVIIPQNPFNIDNNNIPAVVRSNFSIPQSHGLLFMVEPLSRAVRTAGFRAKFTIYDPVGSVVTAEKGSTGTNNLVYFVWDGKNRSGRVVGTGTYMVIVTIESPFGRPLAKRSLVAVYRK